MSRAFNSDMLLIARLLRGLTQEELVAKLGGISQPKLSKIESGLSTPTQEDVDALARALQFKPRFFFHPFYRRASPPTYHRKRKKLTKTDWERIYAKAEIYRICLSLKLNSVEISPVRKAPPMIDPEEYGRDAEKMANALRQYWMVPRGPVADVTRLVEGAGIPVISYDFGTDLTDGFSQHAADNLPPLIFLNARLPRDRLRFTILHELCHIVAHHLPHPSMEDEANKFAAQFLMPGQDIAPDLYDLSIEKFLLLKSKWMVAARALVMTAQRLNKITERSARTYFIKMNSLWGGKSEPAIISDEIEHPRILRQLLDAHLNKLGFTLDDMGNIFGLEPRDVVEFFGVADRPKLRLVIN